MAKRGRPPLDADGKTARLEVSVTARQFDEICRVARRQGVSMAEVVRRVLTTRRAQLEADEDEEDT